MRPSSMAALSSKPTSCLTYQAHQIQLLHPIKADRSCQIFLQLVDGRHFCLRKFVCLLRSEYLLCMLSRCSADRQLKSMVINIRNIYSGIKAKHLVGF